MPDLTAADLYEMVKGWPTEARPNGVECRVGYIARGAEWYAHCMPISTPHAIALHEASGLRWLVGQRCLPEIVHATPSSLVFASMGGERLPFFGPSLLHAIDAAIRATT